MFTLIIGSNTSRKTVAAQKTQTIRQALEEAGIDYSVGSIHLNGVTVSAGEVDKTFADMNVHDEARLIVVVKADSALA